MAGDLEYTGPIRTSTGFVVVDMQEHYLKSHDSAAVSMMLSAQKKLLGYAMDNLMPIFLLEYESDRHFDRGSTISEITDFVNRVSPTVIRKEHNDGFRDTFLPTYLKNAGIDHIFLMGVNKSACVYETALGASDFRIRFSYSEDSVSNRLIWPERGTERRMKWDESLTWLPENAHFYSGNVIDLISCFEK